MESDRPFDGFLGADVPAELEERVKAAARREDRTVASWLRQTVRRRLRAEDRVRQGPSVSSQ